MYDFNIFKRQQIMFFKVNNLVLCEDCKEEYLDDIDPYQSTRRLEINPETQCEACNDKPLNLITYREICVFHGSQAVEIIYAMDEAEDTEFFLNGVIDAYDMDNQGEIYTFDIDCDNRPWGLQDPSYSIGLYFITYNVHMEVFSIHKMEI